MAVEIPAGAIKGGCAGSAAGVVMDRWIECLIDVNSGDSLGNITPTGIAGAIGCSGDAMGEAIFS